MSVFNKLADEGLNVHGYGHHRLVCPQCSATRRPEHRRLKDLSVDVEAEGATGVCHHCGWKFGFKANSKPMKEKPYTRPQYRPAEGEMFERAVKWFAERGISESILRRNRIEWRKTFMPQEGAEVGALCFPYFRRGEIVNVKYRSAQKSFKMEAGAELCLYGLDDIEAGKPLIWVEGEIDKLSMEAAGFTACVSIPNGAPALNATNFERHFSYLDSAKDQLDAASLHIIAVDADAPGRALEAELVRRLGPERCVRVEMPAGRKDANEVLTAEGASVLREAVETARPFPIIGVVEVSDVFDKLMELYENGQPAGEHPGSDLLADFYTVKPGQWTLVTGIPSHGKSAVIDWLMVNLASRAGWQFAVCSPENQPVEEHMAKIAEIRQGLPFGLGPSERMTADDVTEAAAWMSDHFTFIVPEEDGWQIDNVLSIARQLVFRKGVKGLVLDPWNEFEHARPAGMNESEYVSLALGKIRRFAKHHGVHVWVVAHPTKLQKEKNGEYPVPTPYDVSGSAHFRNKADMCLSVWRDLADEDSATQIHIQKVRFKRCGKVGRCDLFYDKPTGRYMDERPYRWGGFRSSDEKNKEAEARI